MCVARSVSGVCADGRSRKFSHAFTKIIRFTPLSCARSRRAGGAVPEPRDLGTISPDVSRAPTQAAQRDKSGVWRRACADRVVSETRERTLVCSDVIQGNMNHLTPSRAMSAPVLKPRCQGPLSREGKLVRFRRSALQGAARTQGALHVRKRHTIGDTSRRRNPITLPVSHCRAPLRACVCRGMATACRSSAMPWQPSGKRRSSRGKGERAQPRL